MHNKYWLFLLILTTSCASRVANVYHATAAEKRMLRKNWQLQLLRQENNTVYRYTDSSTRYQVFFLYEGGEAYVKISGPLFIKSSTGKHYNTYFLLKQNNTIKFHNPLLIEWQQESPDELCNTPEGAAITSAFHTCGTWHYNNDTLSVVANTNTGSPADTLIVLKAVR
ncbi:hypothetical protein HNQ91_003285 [Filimonas zeae]|nr:hypothetical protein [Filimonas zeae]MDR6340220.1 hypothetical protein [Filimonas zeae]